MNKSTHCPGKNEILLEEVRSKCFTVGDMSVKRDTVQGMIPGFRELSKVRSMWVDMVRFGEVMRYCWL